METENNKYLPFLDTKIYNEIEFGIFRKGASINYGHTIFMIFYPSLVLVTGGHISETPYLVWRHIFCNFTPRNY